MLAVRTWRKYAALSFVILLSIAPAHGADESVAAPQSSAAASQSSVASSQPNIATLETSLETLVRQFYPKAKIGKTDKSMHFEFKTKQYDIPQTNTIESGPVWGGIIGDIELKDGHLSEQETLERKLNQYSYYSVMELYPNSPKTDHHLKTRLAYPFDVQPEFLQSFKTIIRNFDSATAKPIVQEP